jgi:hypothetical protein
LLLALCLVTQDPPPAAPDPNVAPSAPADGFKPGPAWKELGKNLWFDPAARALILRARVSLREGYLEHLLCLEYTKEHESVLATEAPPRMIHAGLILVVGEPGQPVRYRPEFRAPTGPEVAIEAEWQEKGETKTADARTFVKDQKTGKALETHWVFAGSELFQDPDTKKMIYAADAGDLITVANFPSAILDLPFASSNFDAERSFVAFTENIPERNTPVTLRFRAVAKAAAEGADPAKPAPAKAK